MENKLLMSQKLQQQWALFFIVIVNTYIAIETRSYTSQNFPKKQYGLETQTNSGENLNVSLMGFPEENDWILHAPYSDKTLIRNVLSAHLFRKMGHYAPRMKFCELFLNDEYQGVYIFIEKIKRDKNRINISKMKSSDNSGDDITGGYILQIDRWTDQCFWFTRKGEMPIRVEYPKCTDLSTQQFQYIKNEIAMFESGLFADENMKPGSGYLNLIDIKSFIDFFIVNEISRNIDAYIKSTFLYKDKDSKNGKITMGPVWDFNIAYGNADYRDGYLTDGFSYNVNNATWYKQLMQDTTFTNQLHKRWFELRNDLLLKENIFYIIDSLSNHLSEPQERNFDKWPVLGKKVWPNYYVGKNYNDEINYLKDWISKRIDWIDKNIPGESSAIKPIEKIKAEVQGNVVSETITINLELLNESNIDIYIYDLTGRIIYKELSKHILSGYSQINIDLFNKNTGSQNMFIVNINCNSENILQQKILCPNINN